MQVTREDEYAVIGLMYLARQSSVRTIMIDEISESERIPKSFLAKIFQSLVKGGLVNSHRGAGGGFTLARPAATITFLQAFQCVEGSFALQKCVSDDPECVVSHDRLRSCTLCGIFSEAQQRVNELFSRTTLLDLLKPRGQMTQPIPVSTVVN